jgi:hypothetical protein
MASSIPEDIEGILRTLAQIYAMQGSRREVAILAKSKPEVEQTDYDNWNGGTYGYCLVLRLPAAQYAQIESDREKIEQDILKRMNPLIRGYQNESINSVLVTLEIENDANWRRIASGRRTRRVVRRIHFPRKRRQRVARSPPSVGLGATRLQGVVRRVRIEARRQFEQIHRSRPSQLVVRNRGALAGFLLEELAAVRTRRSQRAPDGWREGRSSNLAWHHA